MPDSFNVPVPNLISDPPVPPPSRRRKFYDSKVREKLESKDDLRSRGVESPDRADALIGAIMMRLSVFEGTAAGAN